MKNTFLHGKYWIGSLASPVVFSILGLLISYAMPKNFRQSMEGGILVIAGILIGLFIACITTALSFKNHEKFRLLSLVSGVPSLGALIAIAIHVL
jgi:uncharacterized phage infection (PIP) family protein YhgE